MWPSVVPRSGPTPTPNYFPHPQQFNTGPLKIPTMGVENDIKMMMPSQSPRDSIGSSSSHSFSDPHHAGPTAHNMKVDEVEEKRVTIWNWREKRKLSGNAAPFRRNLHEYLRKHPDWEEYKGQDRDLNGKKLIKKRLPVPIMIPPGGGTTMSRERSHSFPPMVDAAGNALWDSLLHAVNEAAHMDGMDIDEGAPSPEVFIRPTSG